jgi:predicted AAA+ superfamily ATPase
LHLADPSLVCAILGASSERLQGELSMLGQVFETAVFHDLSVLSPLGSQVQHYRDSNGHEIDAVISLADGRWAAIEAKLGSLQIQRGAASLASAVKQIDTQAIGEPAFLLVLTGTGPTLTLDNGIVTCPLTALAP